MFNPLTIIFFALGAIVASFVGVLVARLYTGASFLSGRSRCDACNAPLAPLSLLPIVSYLASPGRARCCGARLLPLSPLTELILGGLFALAYLKLGLVSTLPLMLLSISLLLALVLYDLLHQILPPLPLAAFVVAAGGNGFISAPALPGLLGTPILAFLT